MYFRSRICWFAIATEFGKKFNTIGFDISKKRISELKKSIDRTREVKKEDLKSRKSFNLVMMNLRLVIQI